MTTTVAHPLEHTVFRPLLHRLAGAVHRPAYLGLVILLTASVLCGCATGPIGAIKGRRALSRLLPPPENPGESQEDLAALTPAQKPALARYWRECHPQNQRYYAIWPMAYLGGEDVRTLFIDCLRQDGSALEWSRDGYWFGDVAIALGLLAQRDDTALKFLTNAIVPEAWNHLGVPDRAPGSEAGYHQVMATQAIQGLGLSGRTESGVILEGWRKCEPGWSQAVGTDAFRMSVYLAMVKWQVVHRMGVEEYRRKMRTRERGEVAVAWRLSPEGMEWYNWMVTVAPGGNIYTQKELEASFRWQEGLED